MELHRNTKHQIRALPEYPRSLGHHPEEQRLRDRSWCSTPRSTEAFLWIPTKQKGARDGLCKEGSTCKPQDMVTRVGPLPGPKLGALQSCLILAKLNLLLGGLLLQPTGQPGHIEAHMGRQAQPGHTGADRGSQGTRGSSYHAGGSVDCSHSVLKQGKPRSSQPLKICNGTFIL